MHEWLISGGVGTVYVLTFVAFLLQSPIVLIQKKFNKVLNLENSQLGNVLYWIAFCSIGGPFGICIYFYIYMKKKESEH